MSKNMRVPLQSITVQRKVDGQMQAYTPPTGVPFEFTEKEIEHIEKVNPSAFSKEALTDVTLASGGPRIEIDPDAKNASGAVVKPGSVADNTPDSKGRVPDVPASAKAGAKKDEL